MVSLQGMTISVIIPALNEENYIAQTLSQLQSLPGNFEVIVVDGGSADLTLAIVAGFKDIQLISSPKGRAVQMNKGAALAKGDILLFLHADTILPQNAYAAVAKHMEKSDNIGGSFYLKMDKEHPLLRFLTWCSKLSYEFLTYGDQGIFMRKTVFHAIGGYKPLPFLEDVEIQKRLRRAGRFKKLDAAVTTSARRFEKTGTLKQLFLDVLLVAAYKVGVTPQRLKRFYKDHSGD